MDVYSRVLIWVNLTPWSLPSSGGCSGVWLCESDGATVDLDTPRVGCCCSCCTVLQLSLTTVTVDTLLWPTVAKE